MLWKFSISNECFSFKLSIHLRIVKKQHKTVFNIDINQKYLLSSESVYYYDFWRSCDSEDWSNDAEYSALITGINYVLKYTHMENNYF